MNYRDDFERFAHDIINVVQGTGRNGTAQQWQINKVADMLRTGPGVTTWPRDAAEAAQRARDKLQRRLPPLMPPINGKKATGLLVDEWVTVSKAVPPNMMVALTKPPTAVKFLLPLVPPKKP